MGFGINLLRTPGAWGSYLPGKVIEKIPNNTTCTPEFNVLLAFALRMQCSFAVFLYQCPSWIAPVAELNRWLAPKNCRA